LQAALLDLNDPQHRVTMLINKIHHVAYRCADAKQTVEWYGNT
jgi:hypothetical protein